MLIVSASELCVAALKGSLLQKGRVFPGDIVAPLDLTAAQRVTGAISGVVGVDKPVHQVLVPAMGYAQAGGLNDP